MTTIIIYYGIYMEIQRIQWFYNGTIHILPQLFSTNHVNVIYLKQFEGITEFQVSKIDLKCYITQR